MRNLAHLAAQLYNTPLLLLPSVATTISGVFQEMLEGRAPSIIVLGSQAHPAGEGEQAGAPAEAYAGNVATGRFADKPYTVTDAGVAILPVYGPLVQRAGQMTPDCTPLASYQRITARLEAMQADADVRAILLEMDSPGGQAAGMFTLATSMLTQRGNKPVWAHANEAAYSAAYGLSSSADRITAPQAASVGSIGVMAMHMDQSQRDAKQGLVYTPIYAGARKADLGSHFPITPAALATAQAEVNRLYDMFTGHVATARALDQQAVRNTEAGVFAANDARQLGLIDAVQTFDETLAELTDLISRPGRTSSFGGSAFATGKQQPGIQAASHNLKGEAMPQANTAATDPANNTTTATVDQAAIEAARAAGRTEGLAAGATAERTRISSILNHEAAAERPKLARTLALDTDMAAEPAAKVLAAAAPEQQASASAAAAPAAAPSPLAAAMAKAPNPTVGADASNPDSDSPEATAAGVIALFNRTQGVKA